MVRALETKPVGVGLTIQKGGWEALVVLRVHVAWVVQVMPVLRRVRLMLVLRRVRLNLKRVPMAEVRRVRPVALVGWITTMC